MTLKPLAFFFAACGLCAALPAAAQDRPYAYPGQDGYSQGRDWHDRGAYRDDRPYRDDVAHVVDVRPAPGSGEREECWNTRTNSYDEVSGPEKAPIVSRDTAIGAVAGGVIGHQFDSGAVGTIGGAVLGGLAGHAYEQHRNDETAQARQDDLDRSRCRTVRGAPQAFDVRYRYRGQEYLALMDHDPGPTLVPGRDIDDDGHPYRQP